MQTVKSASRATGFDNEKYLREQTRAIQERVTRFENKLYLEFGGKIVFDYHASRVLPGFDPNVKMRLLQNLKHDADIILCIFAGDIERRKVRADFGITYDVDALKLIDDLRSWDIDVTSVVITRYEGQPAAKIFKNKLERRGVRVYTHRHIKGYPTDVDAIVSDDGYGSNPYIESDKSLVIITGPGPNSGKLATCLSQLYHDYRQGRRSGYAKFETFPIWNIPLKHPVNIAYEAATADLKDFNLIDPHHLEANGEKAINYNRDVDVFPVLRRIIEKITGAESFYKSPTDMGVNRAGFGIVDDAAVQEAARQEIIRRYFQYRAEYAMGLEGKDTVDRAKQIMEELSLKPEDRRVVGPARDAAAEAEARGKGHKGVFAGAAIELPDGTIVTGKNSKMMHAASSLVLNAIKKLAGLPDPELLISPETLQSIRELKKSVSSGESASMDLEEMLIAVAISATTNPATRRAMGKLKELERCDVHTTHIPTPGDEAGLRKLGVRITSDPTFATKNLFVL
ncbi:MAG: DUF1846 domain-containing protein [Planctomycetota bacterium]|jgi:uncharacterized protein (UPF0371 family)